MMKNAVPIIGMLVFLLAACDSKKSERVVEPAALAEDSLAGTPEDPFKQVSVRIRQNPNDPDLYLERAKILLNQQQFVEAMNDIDRSLMFDSTNCDYLTFKSDIFLATGKISECRKLLKKCLEFNDQYVEAYLKMAEIFLMAENSLESMRNVNEALKVDVYNAEAYFMKGILFKYSGDTAKAISSLQTAVEQDADHYDAYVQLGLLHSAIDDDLAVAYYNNAIKVKPSSLEARYNKALYLQDHGQPEQAIAIYEEMLEISPDYPEGYFNIGYNYLVNLEDYQKATESFMKAINLYPEYYQAYCNLGLSYEKMGDAKQAEENYRKALKIKPDYTLAAKGLSRLEE